MADYSGRLRATHAVPPLLGARDWIRGLRNPEPLSPVSYNRVVLTVVGMICTLAVVTGVWLIRAPSDAATLAVGSVAMFALSLFSVMSPAPVRYSWSLSNYVHLGLSVTLGPIGAATGAVAEALGVMTRARNGTFRTIFNVSNNFLCGVAAFAVFTRLGPALGPSPLALPLAGLCAGLVHYALNYTLLALVVHAADPSIERSLVLRQALPVAIFSAVYGWSVFGFVVLEDKAGFLGFTALLAPVALLQGAFFVFARRTRAFEEQRAAHAREREALLHKAVEASETERRRIARDLHDGVVQNLSGMAFSMTATLSRLRGRDDGAGGDAEVVDLLERSAAETRQAMKDLRTLIIEIAPPTLRREGLHAALLEVLRTLEHAGTKTRLELPSNMRLRQDRASLIFRVAQEVLRNVAAHAEAQHVSVVLREAEGWAVLRIQDDGRGFTPDDVARRRAEGHVGTNAIVELAEDAGGSLDIESAPGQGTTVTLRLPVEA